MYTYTHTHTQRRIITIGIERNKINIVRDIPNEVIMSFLMHHYFSLHYSCVSNRDAAARENRWRRAERARINMPELCNLSFIVYAVLSDNVITRMFRATMNPPS